MPRPRSRRAAALALSPACALAVFLAVYPALAPSTAVAQAPDQLHTASPAELGVVKILLSQQNYWNAGDIVNFTHAFKNSPDTLFVSTQVIHGYEQILEDYRRNFPTKDSMGQLTYSDFDVHILDDKFALCTGKYHLERDRHNGGAAQGTFSVVLEATPAGWRIILDHTT